MSLEALSEVLGYDVEENDGTDFWIETELQFN